MKTIREALREANLDELKKSYSFKHHPDYLTVRLSDASDKSYDEIREAMERSFEKTVEEMREIPISDDGRRLVLYASYGVRSGQNSFDLYSEPAFLFFDPKEAETDVEGASDYDVSFTPWERSLGFFVADVPLTKKFLKDALVDYVREATSFGSTNEHHEAGTRRIERELEESERDVREGRTYSQEEVEEFMFGKEVAERRRRERDLEMETAVAELNEASYAFFKRFRTRERKRILETIRKERGE